MEVDSEFHLWERNHKVTHGQSLWFGEGSSSTVVISARVGVRTLAVFSPGKSVVTVQIDSLTSNSRNKEFTKVSLRRRPSVLALIN